MEDHICHSDHAHHHNITAKSQEELMALLEYAVHHNASHIEELIQIAGLFGEKGAPAVQETILAAAQEFKEGNSKLEDAIISLK
jgi:hypothetical protein